MAMINTTGVHHIRLTVTDLERSRAFYRDVLGFDIVAESPGDPDDPSVREDPDQLYGGVVFNANGSLLGLRPVAEKGDRFDSCRVGLDHLSFTVPDSGELGEIAARLDGAGIEHGAVKPLDAFGIAILSLSDPDGIHLELSAAL